MVNKEDLEIKSQDIYQESFGFEIPTDVFYLNGRKYTGGYENLNYSGLKNEEGQIINGLIEGIVKSWTYEDESTVWLTEDIYDNGQYVEENCFYKNNVKFTGKRKVYIDEILISDKNYKNGKLDGPYKLFYRESGNIEYDQNYKNGKKDGPSKSYYENGNIEYDWNYKNGKEDGEWRSYSEDGTLERISQYRNGEYISGKDFTEENKIENQSIESDGGIVDTIMKFVVKKPWVVLIVIAFLFYVIF